MEFIVFNTSGTLLFSRSDAEEAHWIQHEMQLQLVFPFVPDKAITRGMRIGFHDPVSDAMQVFEIRTIRNTEPEHNQQITAEQIAIAELSDEHIDSQEITNKTPSQAAQTALSGTGWSVGNVSASNTSSCNFGRGSVWNAIGVIQKNWNVYCLPRVVVSASGITGKYIDIVPAGGTFRGVRLSISKNMTSATVTYDDSDVLTAMYGYGGSVPVSQSSGDDKYQTLTFASVVWSQTASHPAKPSGQTYIEYPEKTALYGRDGRPRFGYYQNGDIDSASLLLEKTWAQLQQSCEPKVSVTGSVTELYRLGYKDQPMALHDIAIVEIEETGELLHREIITLDVDLLDPTNTRPEIGDYIKNIIYINRETASEASGSRGGGGGGRGQSNSEYEEVKTFAEFEKTDSLIGMVVGMKDGDAYIKAGEIALSINETDGTSTALIDADHINISATSTVHTLAGDLEHDADGHLVIKNAGGLYVERTESGVTSQFGVWDDGNLTGGVMVQKINGTTETTIRADKINIDGIVTALAAKSVGVGSLTVEGGSTFNGVVYAEATITAEEGIRSNSGFNEAGTTHETHSFKINNVEVAQFLGTADVNFDRAAAQREGVLDVYISPSDIIISDGPDYSKNGGNPYYDVEIEASTTSTLYPSLSDTATQTFRIYATSAYNDGKTDGASAVTVTVDTGSWTIVDQSTGDYRRTVVAKKNGSNADSDVIYGQSIWNLGWNACRNWVRNHGHTVLSGYSSWNSGNSAALYVAPTGGAQMATGQSQVWRYGGSVVTYYESPASK